MSKWHKRTSRSEATGIGSLVSGPKIPLKVPESIKCCCLSGWLMVYSSKTVRNTCASFFHHADHYNHHLNKPLRFIRVDLLTLIFHFQFIILAAPQNMGKFILAAHHGNQWSTSPLVIKYELSGGLPKSIFLVAILTGYIFHPGLDSWDMSSSFMV